MQELVLIAMVWVVSVACDTLEQLTMLAEKARVSRETAVMAVNQAEGYFACGPVVLIFEESTRKTHGTVVVNGITYQMVSVIAIGAAPAGNAPIPITPTQQFFFSSVGTNS
ncbi:hypothetical protein D6792_03495 [Candidatus Parcubacteria bacterium]|jgi:hypothetical protein|nr:MAG: hypothetical protein D6792_03495 [Candidatus Parcubacteria bacterium]